jgi:hypothetical protein
MIRKAHDIMTRDPSGAIKGKNFLVGQTSNCDSVELSRKTLVAYKTGIQLEGSHSCAHKRQSMWWSGEASGECSMTEWRWNCIVQCEWGTGFKQRQGYEPEKLDV